MKDEGNFFADPKLWISFSALIVSIVSAIYSGRKSSRALAISEEQERRKQPDLIIYPAISYRRLLPNSQVFGFLVSISNPTDINNSVARAELKLEMVRKNALTVYRLPHNPVLLETVPASAGQSPAIALPLRVDAHQTASGWLFLSEKREFFDNGSVDLHQLVLEDSHGVVVTTDALMVRELIDEKYNK